MPQKYHFKVDKCGIISGLDNKRTDLQNYAPKRKSLHTPIPANALSRIEFYSNNPTILTSLYKNMAGKDRKSNYILGNSVGPESSNTLAISKDGEIKLGGGSRWAANPWGTNTMATLFIHLDLIRNAISKIQNGFKKDCPVWPKYEGQTPVPRKKVDLSILNPIKRMIEEAKQSLALSNARIENFKIENIINDIATQCEGLPVVPYWSHSKTGPIDLNHEILLSFEKLDGETKESIAELKNQINTIKDDIARSEFIYLLNSRVYSRERVKQILNLKSEFKKAWENNKLSRLEKENLFKLYVNIDAYSIEDLFRGHSDINIDNIFELKPTLPKMPANLDEKRKKSFEEYVQTYKDRHERIIKDWSYILNPKNN